jgi:glucose/arabinose dehydrogenase/PKD repeat protein
MALATGLVVLVPSSGSAHEEHDHAADVANAAETAVTLPAGFQDVKSIGNITEPTAVAFADDGTAFVALKTGVIKSFDYDSGSDAFEPNASSTNFADLSTTVNNYWDRGLTGITLDPDFGTAGHNFVYVNYAYNRDPRDNPPVVPKWGDPGQQYDDCPTPAATNPPANGCVAMVRISRLTAQKNGLGWEMVPGSEKELVAGGCLQFPSHASGDVQFGPDGMLYASVGDGASFDTQDYGQYLNPCGDPLDEGGSLRSQDYETAGDPLGIGGSIIRINPSPTPATYQMVAYGHRNPWRMTFRPDAAGSGLTTELWNGDVGASNWEEINRLPNATTVTTPVNRGWPCYEGAPGGSARNNAWDELNRPVCESLYAKGLGAVVAPYFSYQTRENAGPLTPGEDCEFSTSSVSGVAFVPNTSNYPAAYKGAMFFSDYARQCIWRLGKVAGSGDPDPAAINIFAQRAGTPVDLVAGPGGDLFYVDYGIVNGQVTENAGGIHRLVYTVGNAAPTATITADKTNGAAPLTVQFSGATSSDPEGDALSYVWDLDGDGVFGEAGEPSTVTASRTYAAGTYDVGLRVDDGHGHTASTTVQIQSGNTVPVLGPVTPDASLTWSVGQTVNFSATATDDEDGPLGDADFTWKLSIRHCPSGVCHTHPLRTLVGVRTGSFQAPDHEYPSHLLLTVIAKDSGGLTAEKTVQLDPKAVTLSFDSSPAGLPVSVGGKIGITQQTFIVGSTFNVSAPTTQQQGLRRWTLAGWSDGGAPTHELVAPATPHTWTATYTPVTSSLTVASRRDKLEVKVNGTRHKTEWTGVLAVGTIARLVAPKSQVKKGVRYVFVKWKDGGPRKRDVLITDAPLVLKAIYHRAR